MILRSRFPRAPRFYSSVRNTGPAGIAVTASGVSYITWHALTPFLGDKGQLPLHPYGNRERSLAILGLGPNGSYLWHTFYGADNSQPDFGASPQPAYRNGNLYVVSTERNWLADGVPPKHAFSGTIDMEVLSLGTE